MKNKKIQTLSLIALSLTYFACSGNEIPFDEGGTGADNKININTRILGTTLHTRTLTESDGSGFFSPGDVVWITVTGNDRAVPKAISPADGDQQLKWSDIGMLEGARTVTFAGCYPLPENVDEAGVFTFDLKEKKNETEADLLLASPVSVQWNSTDTVKLMFKHAMHRMNIVYTSSDGSLSAEELDAITMQCDALSTCTVNTRTSNLSTDSHQEKTRFRITGNHKHLLLVPQSKEGVAMTVTIDGKEYPYTLPDNFKNGATFTSLEGGKSIMLTLDCKKSEKQEPPTLTVTAPGIAGWIPQGQASGEIMIPRNEH